MPVPSASQSPCRVSLATHLEGLREAMVAFVRYGDRAGLGASVPTTPDWTVRRLVAHQGMVHRWAAATVRGTDAEPAAWEREGQAAVDPMEWLRDGAIDVVTAIATAPADLDALVFLADAPPPREFWARRQCHETAIHAVDALSAALGRYPVAADAPWITPELALDGIDELLTGFLPRPVSRLRAEQRQRIVVRPEGAGLEGAGLEGAGLGGGGLEWVVEVSPVPPRTTRVPAGSADGDTLLTGDPVALFLTLWNRSDEVTPTGDWDLWRDSAQVRWG